MKHMRRIVLRLMVGLTLTVLTVAGLTVLTVVAVTALPTLPIFFAVPDQTAGCSSSQPLKAGCDVDGHVTDDGDSHVQ